MADEGNSSKRTPQARARHACLRCRKQKLKCDNERPCALCVRSAVECRDHQLQPPKKRARTASAQQSGLPLQPRADDLARDRLPMSLDGLAQNVSNHEFDDSGTEVRGSTQEILHSPATRSNEERTSTYGLVDQLFQKYGPASGLLTDANALLGRSPGKVSSVRSSERLMLLSDLIGQLLPPREVINVLFDTFTTSVHWFMMVFHEPSLKAELEEMLTTGYVQPHRLSLVILLLVILAAGAKYVAKDAFEKEFPGLDPTELHANLMAVIEEKFLDIFDEDYIESICVCILLGTIYVYNARPKRAFVVLGAALKAAQAMGLHQESTWGQMDPIARQVRRRAWWGLYVYDGFSALSYGKPCSIDDGDWQVGMVSNEDDCSARCPGIDSLELLDDGNYCHVTTMTYHRFKARLYRIGSCITRNVYFKRRASMRDIVERVKDINNRLLEWEKSIPTGLRLSSFTAEVVNANSDPVFKTIHLQALALQISYDNMQLILHRPLLAYDGLPTSVSLSHPVSQIPVDGRGSNADTFRTSKMQCWQSALRTSQIGDYPQLLKTAANTSFQGYIGVQTFTAGVMLAIFALSQPVSPQAQDAKRAIGRLVKLPRLIGYHSAIMDQARRILEELLRMILTEEMKALISDEGATDGDRQSTSTNLTSPTTPGSRKTMPASSDIRTMLPSVQYEATNLSYSYPTFPADKTNSIYGLPSDLSQIEERSPNNVAPSDIQYPANNSFNDALMSLQHVFRDTKTNLDGERQVAAQNTPFNASDRQDYGENTDSGAPSYPPEAYFSNLSDIGLTWIWDDSFQFA